MSINVKKESLVKEIQQQFSILYPFLKIEFLKKSLTERRTVKGMYAMPHEMFHTICSVNSSGTIPVDENLTVAEIEMGFKKQFGVNMQVYRKSGNVWIETTLTDKWTLKKQNQEGEQMSKPNVSGKATSSGISFYDENNLPGQETE